MNLKKAQLRAGLLYLKHLMEKAKDDVDFNETILDIVTKMQGLSKEDVLAISYVTFLIFECEKRLEGVIGHIMKTTSKEVNDKHLGIILSELTFMGKIKIYEKMLKDYPGEYKDLIEGISFFKKLNDIRNQLFHSKIKDIKYKKKLLTDIHTKLLMINDYFKAIGVEKNP